jgi:hypothetical protein
VLHSPANSTPNLFCREFKSPSLPVNSLHIDASLINHLNPIVQLKKKKVNAPGSSSKKASSCYETAGCGFTGKRAGMNIAKFQTLIIPRYPETRHHEISSASSKKIGG